MKKFEEQVKLYPVEQKIDEVVSVEKQVIVAAGEGARQLWACLITS